MEKRVTEHDVTSKFVAMIDNARRSGDTILVERDNKVICRITPEPAKMSTITDFAKWLETAQWPDPDFGKDLQAVIDSQPIAVPENRWE
jgi:hypothetical protein